MPYNTIEYVRSTSEWQLQQRKVTLVKAREFVQFRLRGEDLQDLFDAQGYRVETDYVRQDDKVVEERYWAVSEDIDSPDVPLFKIIYEKEEKPIK